MQKKRNYGYKKTQKGGQNQGRVNMGAKGIPRRIGPYPERPPRENLQVTVDTVIPPLPGKHELIEKPNWDALYKKDYENFEKELEKLNNEKVRSIFI